MSNRPNKRSRQMLPPSKQTSRSTGGSSGNRTGWIVGGVIALVVVVAAVVAIAVSSGGDDLDADVSQTRPVEFVGAALPAFVSSVDDPAVGQVAPELSGFSFSGASVEVAEGRPTLLVFLAHWCPACQNEVPLFDDWEAAGGVPDGVDVIGVATGSDRTRPNYPPSRWLDRENFPFPVIADSPEFRAAAAFGLTSYPYFVLLDGDGRVAFRQGGAISTDVLTQLLEATVD